MKFALVAATLAAILSQAVASPAPEADAVAEAEAWANADSLCYQNCGRAMTEFNKCKGQGANNHNCICSSNSRFHHFYDQCVKCPDYIVNKFSRSLAIPERECGLSH
ncbi:hypothetical protein TRICI_005190 [Trichomonascus ciferrii]|uniref:Extracellular membrane protein CFEM domain-containing protein n=1 Tax=Trichomonascus ciferrii TaxID=44093 RepID=A0A642UZZ8_9ASCO|nr:hypothetical protein TRICI_005190 [Trichomonascus ciferrii]